MPDRAQGPVDARDVAATAALGLESGAGPHDVRQVGEEALMVGDPMEGGGGQDGVDGLHGDGLHQVVHDVVDPIAP